MERYRPRKQCGTCRFYQPQGDGKTGHCRDAKCQKIVGCFVTTIRRDELACRVGWDEDRWESDRRIPFRKD